MLRHSSLWLACLVVAMAGCEDEPAAANDAPSTSAAAKKSGGDTKVAKADKPTTPSGGSTCERFCARVEPCVIEMAAQVAKDAPGPESKKNVDAAPAEAKKAKAECLKSCPDEAKMKACLTKKACMEFLACM